MSKMYQISPQNHTKIKRSEAKGYVGSKWERSNQSGIHFNKYFILYGIVLMYHAKESDNLEANIYRSKHV